MNLDYQAHIGYTLRFERLLRGLSLREVADIFSLSHTIIAKLETAQTELSPSVKEKYEIFLNQTWTWDVSIFQSLQTLYDETLQHILFHDFIAIKDKTHQLEALKAAAMKAGLSFFYHDLQFILDAHDKTRALWIEPNLFKVMDKMNLAVTHPDTFVLPLSLAMVERYHFRLTGSEARLKSLLEQYLNPHHRALVYDRLSDLYYHTFDRSRGIKYGKEAMQTYQAFNNTNRVILCDIKTKMYGDRQHQKQIELPYRAWIDQAEVFFLIELITDITYVQALRMFRFKKYEVALSILETIDITHPQFYHYYVIILYGSNQRDRLKTFLQETTLSAPMIKVFEPALDFVKADLAGADDATLEHHLKMYFESTLKEQLYGESRWAEMLIMAFYLKRRRYKEATLLKERIVQTILR
jgi:transcriptional regulator with XRE-family HTH domain